jgi:uncharacterized protein (DUF433 family)
MRPVFGEHVPESPLAVSFLELVELIVVATFRRKGGKQIPLMRLRAAHSFARERLGVAHPFASLKLKYEGGHIMHEFEQANPGPGKLALDMHGNYVLPLDLEDALDLFEFDPRDQLATRWYPRGKTVPIVLDPLHAAGWPAIEGSNVRLEVLRARWKAGWKIEELAEDFELTSDVVEAALQEAA